MYRMYDHYCQKSFPLHDLFNLGPCTALYSPVIVLDIDMLSRLAKAQKDVLDTYQRPGVGGYYDLPDCEFNKRDKSQDISILSYRNDIWFSFNWLNSFGWAFIVNDNNGQRQKINQRGRALTTST